MRENIEEKMDFSGVETFVVSLGPVPRNAILLDQLSSQGIQPRIVMAVDGRSWVEPFASELVDVKRFLGVIGRMPSGPEIGCALSHMRCARQAQAIGAEFALVFEEDAIILTDLAPAVKSIRGLDSDRPVILQLYSAGKPVLKKKSVVSVDSSSKTVLGLFYVPPGYAVAYLMNRAAIEIFASKQVVEGVADWPPFANKCEFWAHFPWPVSHTNEGSSIEIARVALQPKGKKSSKVSMFLMAYLPLLRASKVREHSRSLGGLCAYVRWVLVPHALLILKRANQKQQGSEPDFYWVR